MWVSQKAYLDHVAKDTRNHHPFMAGVQKIIELENDGDESGERMRLGPEVQQAVKVSMENKAGQRLVKPKKVFIELSTYQKMPRASEENLEVIEKAIDGKLVKGVVALAAGEQEGVYHIEEYEDSFVRKDQEVGDSKLQLTENQGDKAYDHVRNVMRQNTKADAKCKMEDLLAEVLRDEGNDSSDDGDASQSDGSGSGEDASSDEEESDDEDGACQVSTSLFFGNKVAASRTAPKASPKATARPAPAVTPSARTGGERNRSASGEKGAGPSPRVNAGANEQGKRRGRPPRSIEDTSQGEAKYIEKIQNDLNSVADTMDTYMVFNETHNLKVPEELKAFKKLTSDKARELANSKNELAKIQKNLSTTDANQSWNISEQMDYAQRLEALHESALDVFRAMMQDNARMVDKVSVGIKTMRRDNAELKLSPLYLERYLDMLINKALQFHDYAEMGKLLRGDSFCFVELREAGASPDVVLGILLEHVERHFRRCCQLVTMHDASNNGETKQKLGELVREALRHELSWQHEKLTKDCNLWDHLRVIDLVVHCTEYEVAKV